VPGVVPMRIAWTAMLPAAGVAVTTISCVGPCAASVSEYHPSAPTLREPESTAEVTTVTGWVGEDAVARTPMIKLSLSRLPHHRNRNCCSALYAVARGCTSKPGA